MLNDMAAEGRAGRSFPHAAQSSSSRPPLPGHSQGVQSVVPFGAVASVKPEDMLDDEETVAYGARATAPQLLPHLGGDYERSPDSGEVPRSTARGMPVARPSSGRSPAAHLVMLETTESERAFLSSVPNYPPESLPPASFVSQAPVRPSAVRSLFAKVLFVTICAAVLTLLAYEISIGLHLPWLDPRPLLLKAYRAVQHLPLHKLPKLPRL
jgi:hypothetical protein